MHHIERIPATKQRAKGKSLAVFENGMEFELEISQHTAYAGGAVGAD